MPSVYWTAISTIKGWWHLRNGPKGSLLRDVARQKIRKALNLLRGGAGARE